MEERIDLIILEHVWDWANGGVAPVLSLCSPMSLDTGSVHLISLMWLE